jgi:hypothetical protein
MAKLATIRFTSLRRGVILALTALVTTGSTIAVAGGLWPAERDDDAAAASFAVRTVRLLAANRYDVVWGTLHPSHQLATGSRTRYVECERQTLIPGSVRSLRVIAVLDETDALAGIGQVRTKAVRLRIVIAGTVVPEGISVIHTVHVLLVDGAWRWELPDARYAAYRSGSCTTAVARDATS